MACEGPPLWSWTILCTLPPPLTKKAPTAHFTEMAVYLQSFLITIKHN